MKSYITLGSVFLITFSPIALADLTHSAGDILYRRTDNLPGADFTGALPENIDLEAPAGELDDPDSFIIEAIDVDREPGNGGIDLSGDNHDLAFTFQFYDADGSFSFTENYDDRVQVTITPIAGSTDLTETAAAVVHQNTGWNQRSNAVYDFGSGGWFDARIIMTEDGGGAQSAADIGFGFNATGSNGGAGDFGGIGYVPSFGASAGLAVFDTDASGESWGSAIETEAGPGPDSDGDGIDDSYEEQFFPDDLTQLGSGDFDGDGVNDPVEFADGTDPTVVDSDGDGSSDGEEKSNGTDPLLEDSDNDGLLDGVETGTGTFVDANDTGTNPLDADTDDDLTLDGAEVAGGFDPTDPASNPGAGGVAGISHVPGAILYRRTDNLPGADFTGALPENIDLEAPAGELDDPDSFIIEAIDVDREPGNGGIDLSGDNHDLAFTFQFYDADGSFSFTENYDDRVQVTITPIAGSTDLTETAAAVVHQNTGWNQRSNAVYDFGSGGWFDARIIMTEDGGGAQSAADIGFGFNATGSNGGAGDFGGIGYVPSFGASAGLAVFDTDASGESWGSAIETEAGPGPDSDGDGIDDSYEEQFFPDDLTQLGSGDFDGDGVNDPVEFADGTDPTVVDSDGDGSSDGEEKSNGTDPLLEDSDNDGLLDGVETGTGTFVDANDTGTNPLDADTDDDLTLDGAEVAGGFDPTDPASNPGAGGVAGISHVPGAILYRRTDNLPGADFTGALPENIDLEAPAGELDDPDSFIIEAIDVDREPGNGGIDLSGDNHDLAFTFQFYDADGSFSFTENYDDRVQVTITPIAGSTDLTETAAAVVHQNTGWNQRSNAVYDFGSGGWFDARIIMTEDGGGAQSAADIGFGFNATGSNGGAGDFGGIGYVPSFGASAGLAVFDTDASGESWGSAIETEAGPGPDSDGDGIDDSYEEQFFPDDLTQLGSGDFDGDGVNDPVEFADGTDPTVVDSDGDGSSDGEEKSNGTDPLLEDSDNDGLLDGVETGTGTFVDANDTGTNPLDSDTDDDGLLDGAETNTTVFNGPTDTGSDPLDPDTDGDTFTDGDEVSVGFDPNDEDSHPRSPLAPSGALHLPESILYRRTDGLPGADFTGELPQNIDEEEPRGEIDDPDTSIITAIDVDREPGNGGIDLTGDNHDLAFTFQFYDTDGTFTFTENYDDRVQVTVTPIASARDLAETAAPVVHQNTGWNQRSFASYNFGRGGWFDARILMSEDGGGAQSAADIGFGYYNGDSSAVSDFGGIGYAGVFGASSGDPAEFDTDANGDSWGSLIIVPETIDAYQFKVSSPDGGVNLEFSWNSFAGQEYSIVSTNDLAANPNSSTWSVVPGLEGIAGTPPRNVLSIPKPLDPVRFYKLIGGPIPPLFFDDFESGQGGWTTREDDQERNTLWELGIPSGTTGPLSGAGNSANAWSTNLGDYGPNSDISLRSPAINLGNVPSAQVTFDVYRDADGFADTAVLRFLRATDEVQLGPEIVMDMTIFDIDWVTLNIAVVPEAIGENVIIEWNFVSDGSLDSFSGFSIDNVGVDAD